MSNCSCGSGWTRRDLIDARGIFCTFVCDRCEPEKRLRFRADIFEDGAYSADEQIDED